MAEVSTEAKRDAREAISIEATTLAEQIIAAGARRRGELPDQPALPSNSTAAEIVRAGKRRRGEIADELDSESLAAKILEAGKRRRGEIV